MASLRYDSTSDDHLCAMNLEGHTNRGLAPVNVVYGRRGVEVDSENKAPIYRTMSILRAIACTELSGLASVIGFGTEFGEEQWLR